MRTCSLLVAASTVAALAFFAWRARPHSPVNRWFSIFTAAVAGWVVAIAAAHAGAYPELALRTAFAAASIIPAGFLGLTHYYPVPAPKRSLTIVYLASLVGVLLALVSLTTPLIVFNAALTPTGVQRQTGPLYPVFGLYFLLIFGGAVWEFFKKWGRSSGSGRSQLKYLGAAVTLSGAGATTTNLLLPLITGSSSYTWIGPYFSVLLVGLVAHAIIRHRLMELRLVIHRGLAIAMATVMSLLPVGVFLFFFWSQISTQIPTHESLILLVCIVAAALLVPSTRDIAERLIDRYLYRTRPDYRSTIRDVSHQLTQVLDLKTLLAFISRTVVRSMNCEVVTVFLMKRPGLFVKAIDEHPNHTDKLLVDPVEFPPTLLKLINSQKQFIALDDEANHEVDEVKAAYEELNRHNWALVLPLVFEDTLIGLIAVGAKLSGDPFYPHDLDLLTTLANQAGIAIKNAQLYTQVVLANEYIENIVATIESGVVAIDPSGVITMFNRAAQNLTGITAEDIEGQSLDALPEVLAAVLRATLTDGQGRTEPEVALPDGKANRPVLCATSALRDPVGIVLGAVAVFSDLTPLKQLESQRRRAERLAYFEVLASSLAHEIKNPLVAIKTFSQLVPRRLHDMQFVEEFSRIITREIGRMERLVERLRRLSHSGDRHKQPIDVRLTIRDAVEFLKPAFDEKRIRVEAPMAPLPAIVVGDHSELEQLFINLLMNAHEATPPDGTVAVTLNDAPGQVTVSVTDSGPGIPPELLEQIFDPFITTKQRGSGLGLTICAGIAAAHRAKLRAANGPNGGAFFTVEFPAAAAVGAPVHEDSPARNAG